MPVAPFVRAVALAAALLLGEAGAGPAVSSPSPTGGPAVGVTRPLAALTRAAAALSSPRWDARRVTTVPRRRPITGEQTVLPIIGRATDRVGTQWLKVLIPGRPNGRSGWIVVRGTSPVVTRWRIIVRLSAREVLAVRGHEVVRTFPAVVGKPATPTPTGHFFVEETVKLGPHDVGAPYALALSARSDVLQEFAGGPGQIALHGTDNIGGVPGSAVSHGCVRLTRRAITWLAGRIGPGTPVTIDR